MRSAVVFGLLAAGAVAWPFAQPKAEPAVFVTKTNTNVVWVTVTQGAVAPKQTGVINRPKTPVVHATPTPRVVATPTPQVVVPQSTASKPVPSPIAAQQEAARVDPFINAVLEHHNIHRANHSVSPLVWDVKLAATAEKIGKSCNYAHDTQMDGGGYGQNIAAGAPVHRITQVISDLFVNGEANMMSWNFKDGKPTNWDSDWHKYGHWTQVLWKNTKSVGCAVVTCKKLSGTGANVAPYFTICNYSPPGNYANQVQQNVFKGAGRPTVNGDYHALAAPKA